VCLGFGGVLTVKICAKSKALSEKKANLTHTVTRENGGCFGGWKVFEEDSLSTLLAHSNISQRRLID
jgi:hypothetical protein